MKVNSKRVYSKRKLPTPTPNEIKKSKKIPENSEEESRLHAKTFTKDELDKLDEILDEQAEMYEGMLLKILFFGLKSLIFKKIGIAIVKYLIFIV